jgi:hypothetical protein
VLFFAACEYGFVHAWKVGVKQYLGVPESCPQPNAHGRAIRCNLFFHRKALEKRIFAAIPHAITLLAKQLMSNQLPAVHS